MVIHQITAVNVKIPHGLSSRLETFEVAEIRLQSSSESLTKTVHPADPVTSTINTFCQQRIPKHIAKTLETCRSGFMVANMKEDIHVWSLSHEFNLSHE